MPTLIVSDTAILTKIKMSQYRHQIPPMALLMIAFFINFFLSEYNMRYPSLALVIVAIAWYLYAGFCFRFRANIPAPEAGLLLSPLTGRVMSLKRSSDLYQLKIAKSSLDMVEIRCPHESAVWEGDNLRCIYQEVPLIFRFEARELVRFESANMQPGNIIGMLVGSGTYSINLPTTLETHLNRKDICEAGQTALVI